MTDWKSCENCSNDDCPWNHDGAACNRWEPIRCRCGGALSDILERKDKNGKVIKRYRHCYSCHFEFEEA